MDAGASSPNNYNLATLYARVGDGDRAFHFLDKVIAEHSEDLTLWLLTDPAYDPLRADPRFQGLLRRLHRIS